jgi:hypothetical protein
VTDTISPGLRLAQSITSPVSNSQPIMQNSQGNVF